MRKKKRLRIIRKRINKSKKRRQSTRAIRDVEIQKKTKQKQYYEESKRKKALF